jgi:hypothetical protein
MALQSRCSSSHCSVFVAPAASVTMMLCSTKTLQSKAICSRAFSKHSVRRPTRLNAALLETISFDSVGKLTWDAQQVETLPGKAEILEGYELRPDQVTLSDFTDVFVGFMICIDDRGICWMRAFPKQLHVLSAVALGRRQAQFGRNML